LCAVFPRVAGKHRTQMKMEYRSAEGWQGQLRKS